MTGHKIFLYGEIWLIIPKLSPLPLLIWSTDVYVTVRVGASILISICGQDVL